MRSIRYQPSNPTGEQLTRRNVAQSGRPGDEEGQGQRYRNPGPDCQCLTLERDIHDPQITVGVDEIRLT
jgi:hypothetical protein